MPIKDKYIELKHVAIGTLAEFEDGVYYDSTLNFERTKKYPYPLLRWAIANELYNEPGTTLSLVGRVLGVKHCTLSVSLYKYNDIITGRTTDGRAMRIIDLFHTNLRRYEEGKKECFKLGAWGIDITFDDYIGVISELPEKEKEFYIENDDMYVAFSTRI